MKLLALALLLDISPLPKAPPPPLRGRIAFLDTPRERCAVDVRLRDGVVAGRRFRVIRGGQEIGRVVIMEVQQWGSWAAPEGDTPFEELRKDDIVRVVEQK